MDRTYCRIAVWHIITLGRVLAGSADQGGAKVDQSGVGGLEHQGRSDPICRFE